MKMPVFGRGEQTRVPVGPAAIAALWLGLAAAPGSAQSGRLPRTGVDAVAGFMSDFPSPIDRGCHQAAVSLGARGFHAMHRWLSVEAGIGVQVSVLEQNITDCGGLIPPPQPGVPTIISGYTGGRSNAAVVPEARLVITPVDNAGGSLRLLGGAGWYLGRDTPAWLVGAGLRFRWSASSLVLDVERWNAGVPIDTRRVTTVIDGADIVEPISSDREWIGFFQYRLGFSVRVH